MKIVLIYTASWLSMVILAILNGAIREKVYGKFMGELTAHQLSTLPELCSINRLFKSLLIPQYKELSEHRSR